MIKVDETDPVGGEFVSCFFLLLKNALLNWVVKEVDCCAFLYDFTLEKFAVQNAAPEKNQSKVKFHILEKH